MSAPNDRKERFDLLDAKRWHHFVDDILGTDGTDAGASREHQWLFPGQVADEGANGSQAIIAALGTVSPVCLQMIEEFQNKVIVEIFETEGINVFFQMIRGKL